MDKRTLIAILLTLAVLIGYQFLVPAPQPPPQEPVPVSEAEKKEAGTAPVSPPVIHPTVGAADIRDVRVETDLYTAVMTSKGGTFKSFEAKRFKDKGAGGVSLLKAGGLIPPLALGISTEDFGISNAAFTLRGSDLNLKGKESGSIVFLYSAPPLSVVRTFTFYADSYRIDLKDEVTGIGEYWIALGSEFGYYERRDTSAPHIGPVILKETDRKEFNVSRIKEPETFREGIRWIAQEDKYFFASLVPLVKTEARVWQVRDSAGLALKANSGENRFIVYAGPKEYDRLKEMKVGLEHIVDFGFFSILARPLFWILKFFYAFVGNYGWAIVLLTVVVRMPFIPLINKGQKSMKRLQELQPKLTEIREKYKKDPQRMQKETMEMYKKYKVNPMGGCLPLLLQIPVFFALYKVLLVAVELRGAPFMLWISDLSAPDTLFGHIPSWFPLIGGFAVGPLPIAMGITTIIQQKMTPTSLDPAQNRMMMIMPVVFTFIFLNLASGLVLYWLVNNMLSIAQQFYVNWKASRPRA